MLSEAGHFLLFLQKEAKPVTGYPLLCFHVIGGREKTRRAQSVKNGGLAICKPRGNCEPFAVGQSRACWE